MRIFFGLEVRPYYCGVRSAECGVFNRRERRGFVGRILLLLEVRAARGVRRTNVQGRNVQSLEIIFALEVRVEHCGMETAECGLLTGAGAVVRRPVGLRARGPRVFFCLEVRPDYCGVGSADYRF